MIAGEKHCDLMVIGCGMAGMAASLFAANRGISTMVIGNTGSMRFFSGLIDLMSVYPAASGRTWEDPWAAIQHLSEDHDHPHPYSRIKPDTIKTAINEFLLFLSESDLVYHTKPDANQTVITSVGTCKHTFGVPETMAAGEKVFQEKAPCLLVGFPELKGFSAHQIKESMGEIWPLLRSVELSFPNRFHELFPEQMATELENERCREKLAQSILPHIHDAAAVGIPAILGIQNSGDIHRDMEKRLGVPVFEIPTLPPSIPGLRLKMIFEHQLVKRGVEAFFQQQVEKVVALDTGQFIFHVGEGADQFRIHAKGVILATGRFFSKGLYAKRTGIRETLFDLPVSQPENRTLWHHPDFFTRSGHNINMAGLEIDDFFHPLDEHGKPAWTSLFAAGSILAHQDWMRMKCGSGLSIATAYAAVEAFWEQVPDHDF